MNITIHCYVFRVKTQIWRTFSQGASFTPVGQDKKLTALLTSRIPAIVHHLASVPKCWPPRRWIKAGQACEQTHMLILNKESWLDIPSWVSCVLMLKFEFHIVFSDCFKIKETMCSKVEKDVAKGAYLLNIYLVQAIYWLYLKKYFWS